MLKMKEAKYFLKTSMQGVSGENVLEPKLLLVGNTSKSALGLSACTHHLQLT